MQQHLQESDKRIEDRFFCIDDDVYHIGASIKDLGKKWFGFSKMEILTPDEWWKGSIESNQYATFQEYKY